jgi:hypothetical protein
MNTPQSHPPPPSAQPYEPPAHYDSEAWRADASTLSLVLAVIAPFGLAVTASPAVLATLLTYPDEGPSAQPWIAPLVFWSVPLLVGLVSVTVALIAIRGAKAGSSSRASAAASLWINGSVFAVGLYLTALHVRPWLFG